MQRQSRKPMLHWFRNGSRHKEPKPTLEVEWEGWAVCHQWSSIRGRSLPSVLMLPKAGYRIFIYGSSLGEKAAHGMTRRRMIFLKPNNVFQRKGMCQLRIPNTPPPPAVFILATRT